MKNRGEQNVLLVIDKQELKQKIGERLLTGRQFLSQNIATKEQYDKWWDDFITWDMYNEEMLKQAFDKPDNTHAQTYKRSSGTYVGPLSTGSYKEPTFQESVKSCRDEMDYQVKKLGWFFDKIELLKQSETLVKTDNRDSRFNQLTHLLSKFHKICQELRARRQDRATLIISDEYDVQDLLNALLHLHFDDIRKEDYSPSNSGANSRLDFVLKKEKIILEIKMTSERFGTKELGDQILIDVGRYKAYPDCSDLVVFIYDKGDHIRNKRGFIADLQKQSTPAMKVTVIINPE